MKTAKVYVSTVEFECPYCREIIPSFRGSHFFLVEDIPEKGNLTGEWLYCADCDKYSNVPAKARKWKAE